MDKSRRKFLKQSAMGLVALQAASLPALRSSAEVRPNAAMTAKAAGATAKRVVLLSLDGICVEGYRQAYTPNLDALFAEGTLSLETRVVMPSITLPNWTSHLCGSGPEVHGVSDNSWTLDNFILPAIQTDGAGYYPSVFKVLKDNVPGMKTAFYYNWMQLIYPYNQQYIDQVSFLEDDAYEPNYQKALEFIRTNRDNPTLVFLYSVHTDHAGHAYGWMTPEYIRSIEEADVQIGKFLAELDKDGLKEETHFMFLTDHGGIGKNHGGLTTDEMIVPWGITGPGIRRVEAMQEPNNTVNTAGVILRLFGVEQPLCWTSEVPASLFG